MGSTGTARSAGARVLIVLVVLLLALLLPEVGFLVAIGGVDLAWALLLASMAPVLASARTVTADARDLLAAVLQAVSGSMLLRPRGYSLGAGFATAWLLLTGSLAGSMLFLLPALVPAAAVA